MSLTLDDVSILWNLLESPQFRRQDANGQLRAVQESLTRFLSELLTAGESKKLSKDIFLSRLKWLVRVNGLLPTQTAAITNLINDINSNSLELKRVLSEEEREFPDNCTKIEALINKLNYKKPLVVEDKKTEPVQFPNRMVTGVALQTPSQTPYQLALNVSQAGIESAQKGDWSMAKRGILMAATYFSRPTDRAQPYYAALAECQANMGMIFAEEKQFDIAFNWVARAIKSSSQIPINERSEQSYAMEKEMVRRMREIVKEITKADTDHSASSRLANINPLYKHAFQLFQHKVSAVKELEESKIDIRQNVLLILAGLYSQFSTVVALQDTAEQDVLVGRVLRLSVDFLNAGVSKQEIIRVLEHLHYEFKMGGHFIIGLPDDHGEVVALRYFKLLTAVSDSKENSAYVLRYLNEKNDDQMSVGHAAIRWSSPESAIAYLKLLGNLQQRGFKAEVFNLLIGKSKDLLRQGDYIASLQNPLITQAYVNVLKSLVVGENAVPRESIIVLVKKHLSKLTHGVVCQEYVDLLKQLNIKEEKKEQQSEVPRSLLHKFTIHKSPDVVRHSRKLPPSDTLVCKHMRR